MDKLLQYLESDVDVSTEYSSHDNSKLTRTGPKHHHHHSHPKPTVQDTTQNLSYETIDDFDTIGTTELFNNVFNNNNNNTLDRNKRGDISSRTPESLADVSWTTADEVSGRAFATNRGAGIDDEESYFVKPTPTTSVGRTSSSRSPQPTVGRMSKAQKRLWAIDELQQVQRELHQVLEEIDHEDLMRSVVVSPQTSFNYFQQKDEDDDEDDEVVVNGFDDRRQVVHSSANSGAGSRRSTSPQFGATAPSSSAAAAPHYFASSVITSPARQSTIPRKERITKPGVR
eukprot:PhM_4_TR3213/c0_g2_i1/m.79780